ncbi:antiviral reverse transcriptase Drt4, partial [Chloroflexota bacterium]
IFTSSSLTKEIAQEISRVPSSRERKIGGFDCVKYYSTRYNNVPRLLSIPHPKPYCELCLAIYNNWNQIKHICDNSNSIIVPRQHSDKRIIIMDYENSSQRHDRYYKLAFGKKFLVKSDISNFYPSLYSHAIPWALVGKSTSKQNRFDSSKWYNILDTRFRTCVRNETNGVPIGPATSNIASEIILERIDRDLKDQFTYIRFIDDYTVYCTKHSDAEDFIKTLSRKLIDYGFNLNINKTEIIELPQAIEQEWVNEIKKVIPSDDKIEKSHVVSHVLDSALILQKDNPDGSILKYAAKSLVNKLTSTSLRDFVNYVIELCFYHPILIPILNKPLEDIYKIGSEDYKRELLLLLEKSIEYRRSDSIAWLLYYLRKYHKNIPTKIARSVIETGDCIALTILTNYPRHRNEVVEFAKNLDKTDPHMLDNYWLLLYQLYFKKLIPNPYKNDNTFKILRSNKVSFLV